MQRMWNVGDETSCFGGALICASVKQLEGMSNSTRGVTNPQQPLRLTASGLLRVAALPMRGNNRTHA